MFLLQENPSLVAEMWQEAVLAMVITHGELKKCANDDEGKRVARHKVSEMFVVFQ